MSHIVLSITAVGLIAIALALAFFYAPTEAIQGDVQRLFYIHAPTAWVMYLAFIIVAAASVMVLARRDDWERWDRIAVSAAEVGLLFITLVLTVGPYGAIGRGARGGYGMHALRRRSFSGSSTPAISSSALHRLPASAALAFRPSSD